MNILAYLLIYPFHVCVFIKSGYGADTYSAIYQQSGFMNQV